jgi:hypothetical protein
MDATTKNPEKGTRESQIDLWRRIAIADAEAEQLKSQGAADCLDQGPEGSIALPQQIVGSRRRTEDILIDMCDRLKRLGNRHNKVKTGEEKVSAQPGKSNGRRGRRSPRILTDNRA